MAVRSTYPYNGKRFIGNKLKKEVHDCYMERISFCKIDEIESDFIVTFIPDTLEQAQKEGYKNCSYCLGVTIKM